MIERPSVRATSTALTAGTLLSALLLVVAFVLAGLDLDEPSRLLSTAAVIVLLATPALGLVITTLELRHLQPRAAALAVVVLAILALATAIALLSR